MRRVVTVILVALVLAGCGGATSSAPSSPGATRSTTTPPTITTRSQRPPVVTAQLALVDTSRPVSSGGSVLASSRALTTTVVRPDDAGRHPLVLVLPGYGVGPSTYLRVMTWLAHHEMVAAAPSFPLADPAQGHALDRADIPTEATDTSFVLTSLEHGPLADHLTPGAVAVLGHSDGADVALVLGYDPHLRDPRITAVISVAPDPIESAVLSGGPPLLLIHGSADQIVPPSSSGAVFSALSAQRWSLTLLGADHASAIVGPSPWTATFDTAVHRFLSATVGGAGTAHLTEELEALPSTEVASAPGP